MPLASVKNRSNRPVISFSICSGGMPEKNVATTTTGILIEGNRSTGIRTRLVSPTTHVIGKSRLRNRDSGERIVTWRATQVDCLKLGETFIQRRLAPESTAARPVGQV